MLRDVHPSDDGYLLGVDRLGLDRVVPRDGGWSVGAAVSAGALRDAVPLPALAQATHSVGGPAIQNMATVGGNVFAPAPAGDLAVRRCSPSTRTSSSRPPTAKSPAESRISTRIGRTAPRRAQGSSHGSIWTHLPPPPI